MDPLLNRLRDEIELTTMGLRESDWNRAPEGRWSSAQTMEHLGRTYGTTAKMLELAMGVGGPARVRSPQFKEFLKQIMVVHLGMFPTGMQAPVTVMPKGDPGPIALERALINLTRMDAAIAEAEERWGGRKPIATHLVLGPLTAGQWRKFHYVHGHHHVLQMRRKIGKK